MVTPTAGFTPAMITGITIHPENPLEFDFIIDTGNSGLDVGTGLDLSLQDESEKLIKYFLAALTVPEEEMWVNLSPYEKDRIIPEGFGTTEMGRDLLAQDYILKQLTASLMYPEKELGKKFWDKIYRQAREKYGTAEIPVNTFNKVWIVPEKAVVYESGNSAFVVKSRLRVMLEEDYQAMNAGVGTGLKPVPTDHDLSVSTEIIREVILPEIEKEVNEGKSFANLRQIYNSAILAAWFKQKLKVGTGRDLSLLGQVYVDKSKTKGVDVEDKTVNQKIYEQYLEAFKKGVYNYIKEDYDPATQEVIPRKYFSGGTNLTVGDLVETYEKGMPLSRPQQEIVGEYLARLEEYNQGMVNVNLVELSEEMSVADAQKTIRQAAGGKQEQGEAKKASSPVQKITSDTKIWTPDLDIVLPIDASFIENFRGWLNWNGFDINRRHPGFDFAAYLTSNEEAVLGLPENTPVRAVADGTVLQILRAYDDPTSKYDVLINIGHGEITASNGDSMLSSYAHLIPLVQVGQKVRKGEIIGKLHKEPGLEKGNLVHLHFRLSNAWGATKPRDVDPVMILFSEEKLPVCLPQKSARFTIPGRENTSVRIANFKNVHLRSASSPIKGLHFKPELRFRHDQPLSKEEIAALRRRFTRTNEQVRALLQSARERGVVLSITGHLRGVDIAGTSLDLPRFQAALTEKGVRDLDQLPSTIAIASEFTTTVEFGLAANPNQNIYVAEDYGFTQEAPHVFEGEVALKNGRTPTGQLDGINYITWNVFGASGVKITVASISPMALAGGMESSAVLNIAIVAALSILTGADLSLAEISALTGKIENNELGGKSGAQGHLATFTGGIYRQIWLSGVKDRAGNSVHPYSAMAVPLLNEDQFSLLEKHMFLVQAGKEYKNGKAVTPRTSALVNDMRLDLLNDKDKFALPLIRETLGLTTRSTRAVISVDFLTMTEIAMRYVEIWDALAKRWLELMLDAHQGKKGAPAYAHEYARKVFDKNHPEYTIYKIVRDIYAAEGEEGVRRSRLYSMDPIASLIESAKAKGIAIMPLGAGAPGANSIAIDPQGIVHLEEFLGGRGMSAINEDDARALIRGKRNGVLKGYMPFRVGKNPMQFNGFKEIGLTVPQLPAEQILTEDAAGIPASSPVDDKGFDDIRVFDMYEGVRKYVRPAIERMIRENLVSLVPPHSSVLEIGSGIGELRTIVGDSLPEGVNWIESDQNEDFLKAPRNFPTQKEVISLPQMPFEDGSLSTIVGLSMLDTLENDVLLATMKEAIRVLTPGGRFIHGIDLVPDITIFKGEAEKARLAIFPYSNASNDLTLYLIDRDLLEKQIAADGTILPGEKMAIIRKILDMPEAAFSVSGRPEVQDIFDDALAVFKKTDSIKKIIQSPEEKFHEIIAEAALDAGLETERAEKIVIDESFDSPEITNQGINHVVFRNGSIRDMWFDYDFAKANPDKCRIRANMSFFVARKPASSPVTAQQRIEEIKSLLPEIKKELANPGTGNLPEVAMLSDFHGGLNRFTMLLSDVLNKFSGFKGQLDPNRAIEEQLAEQGLSFKDIKGQIILGGDILDRGKHGIKIFFLVKELVEKGEGKVVYVTGNHDFWAFANLSGVHLPWYKGFQFYGDSEAANFIAQYRRTNPELFDTPESVLWWTERLAEHNAVQDAYQKKAFNGKVKEVREQFIKEYTKYQKDWTDPQKDAMEKFIGYFSRIGVADPYIGLNGLGKASVSWWRQVVQELNQGREARRSLGAEDAELSVWQNAISSAEQISREVSARLDQAVREGKWWYLIFESINTHAYRSVEWSAKDWSSHKGWGDSVIDEVNEMIDAGLIREEKLTQKNYIQSPTLQALARFYRENFNLYALTPYGDLFSHGGFPVNVDGTIDVSYKGVTYKGRDIFTGLSAVSNDVNDTQRPLHEIWEALNLVNSWYADMTTELKPNYIKRNMDQIGILKINQGMGVRHHVTGHNPIALGKLAGHPFMAKDSDYTHAFSDFGMSEKYGGQGGWVSMSAAGLKLRGFESGTSDALVDNPRTHVWDKETGEIKKTIENPGLEGKPFLTGAKEQLGKELARLETSSPVTGINLQGAREIVAGLVQNKIPPALERAIRQIMREKPDPAIMESPENYISDLFTLAEAKAVVTTDNPERTYFDYLLDIEKTVAKDLVESMQQKFQEGKLAISRETLEYFAKNMKTAMVNLLNHDEMASLTRYSYFQILGDIMRPIYPDLYEDSKAKDFKMTDALYAGLRERMKGMKNADEALKKAMLWAGMSNVLERAYSRLALEHFSIDDHTIQERSIEIGEPFENLNKILNRPENKNGTILIYLDNSGELPLNMLEAELLLKRGFNVVFVAKDKSARDDLTVKDVEGHLQDWLDDGRFDWLKGYYGHEARAGNSLTIISSDSAIPGLNLASLSDGHKRLRQEAILSIVHGGGNFYGSYPQALTGDSLYIYTIKEPAQIAVVEAKGVSLEKAKRGAIVAQFKASNKKGDNLNDLLSRGRYFVTMIQKARERVWADVVEHKLNGKMTILGAVLAILIKGMEEKPMPVPEVVTKFSDEVNQIRPWRALEKRRNAFEDATNKLEQWFQENQTLLKELDFVKSSKDLMDVARQSIGLIDRFGEVSSGRGYSMTKVNVREVVESSARLFRSLHPEIDLSVHVSRRVPEGEVSIPEAPFQDNLAELLKNAEKYSDKGTILIHLDMGDDAQIEVRVTNSGSVLTPDEQGKVFDYGVRLAKSRNIAPGSGVGLFGLKVDIESLGGRVIVESDPEKGTTFGFTMPMQVSSPFAGNGIIEERQRTSSLPQGRSSSPAAAVEELEKEAGELEKKAAEAATLEDLQDAYIVLNKLMSKLFMDSSDENDRQIYKRRMGLYESRSEVVGKLLRRTEEESLQYVDMAKTRLYELVIDAEKTKKIVWGHEFLWDLDHAETESKIVDLARQFMDTLYPLEPLKDAADSATAGEGPGRVSGPSPQGAFTKGGIDLNPGLFDLQIRRDANGVPLPLPQQPIEKMNIEGFIPVIINITPVTNLPLLLGLADTEDDADEEMPAMKAREPEEISALN